MPETLFACRLLQAGGGEQVPAKLFAPQPRGNDWICRVQIGEEPPFEAHGVDSLQALTAGFTALVSLLRYLEHTCPGQYSWEGDSDLSSGLDFATLRAQLPEDA